MPDTTHFHLIDVLAKGQSGPPTTVVTLANGLNSNIPLPTTERVRISGPSAAFSIDTIVFGGDGRKLRLYNTTAQTMTLINQSGGTLASYRIITLSGANLVLRANATSFVTLGYDGVDNRWIVESFN